MVISARQSETISHSPMLDKIAEIATSAHKILLQELPEDCMFKIVALQCLAAVVDGGVGLPFHILETVADYTASENQEMARLAHRILQKS